MPVAHPESIGIIGAGKLGRTLASLSLAAGFSVLLHGSGPRARTARIIETFAPGAVAATLDEVVAADIVVLAIGLSDAEELDSALFHGVVVDPMNYWEEADGPRPDFDDAAMPTSVLVKRWLPGASVVKAFNHVAYRDLAGGSRRAGDPHRWGIAVVADDTRSAAIIAAWVDALGFDPVVIEDLASTYALQPGQALFGATLSSAELRRQLG